MGLLADVFSWGDKQKRRVRGLLDNPKDEARVFAHRSLETGRDFLLDPMNFIGGGLGTVGKVARKTQYELAHETAQRNAALPVEQGGLGLPANNTAMDRARAMGFDTEAYHGTQKPFDNFDPALSDSARKTGVPSGAVVVSSSPRIASTYAADNRRLEWAPDFAEGANLIPLVINKGDGLSISARGKYWNDLPQTKKYPSIYDVNDFASIAKERGADSATINNVVDSARLGMAKDRASTTFVFDPTKIRSRFAAFDPMRRNESDLLAGLAPYAIPFGLLGLLGRENDSQ